MNEMLTKITAKQRIDMLLKGLSPINPDDIKKYLKGGGVSLKENQERTKTLFEGIPQNLGSGYEKNNNGRPAFADFGNRLEPDYFNGSFIRDKWHGNNHYRTHSIQLHQNTAGWEDSCCRLYRAFSDY